MQKKTTNSVAEFVGQLKESSSHFHMVTGLCQLRRNDHLTPVDREICMRTQM